MVNKKGDPDRGPQMREGEQKFDKGYMSDDEYALGGEKFPSKKERGNNYMPMRHEIDRKDSAKLARSKFSKIA